MEKGHRIGKFNIPVLSVNVIPQGGYSGFQVTGMIKGFFLGVKFLIPGFIWVRKFDKCFFGVAWFFIGTFGGIKKNRYCPGGCIALRIKYRQTNVFCFCLIVNYGVALHRTCYTIVCIVPWYPAVYKTSTTSIQSVGFTVTEIPLNALVNFWFLSNFWGQQNRHGIFWGLIFGIFFGFCWKP